MTTWIEFPDCFKEVAQHASEKVELWSCFWNDVGTDEADENMQTVLAGAGFEIVETGQAEAIVRECVHKNALHSSISRVRKFALENSLQLGSIEVPMASTRLVLGYSRTTLIRMAT